MLSAVSKTSRSVARPAATTEKLLLADPGNISQLFARLAVARQESPSSPKPTGQFIAVIVSQKPESRHQAEVTKHGTNYKRHGYRRPIGNRYR